MRGPGPEQAFAVDAGQRLVERYAPDKVILFGSLARGHARWDSDADVLVVMPFEGRHLAMIHEMR